MTRTAPAAFAVVGNPGNRRVALFQEAVRAAGLPEPRVVPWRDVLTGRAVFRAGENVRIDSPGEDPEVEGLLRGTADTTRVEGTGLWYRRFTEVVHTVAQGVRSAGGTLTSDPDDLGVLFDKRLCHGVLAAAGIPVPASPTSGPDAVRTPVRGWEEVRGCSNSPATGGRS